MSREIPTDASAVTALLALRRTLWQLVFLGAAAALACLRYAPDAHAAAAWCALLPLCSLAVHCRHELLAWAARRFDPADAPPAVRDTRLAQARRVRGAVRRPASRRVTRPGPARALAMPTAR